MYTFRGGKAYSPSNESLVGEGRGLPCLIAGGRLHLFAHDQWCIDGRPLRCTARMPLRDAAAATSAYFGPLADYSMRLFLNAKFMMMHNFLLWCNDGSATSRMHHLAPLCRLHGDIKARMSDGGLWDFSAICGSIWGLKQERCLLGRPLVIVLTSERFAESDWWAETRAEKMVSEACLFDGAPRVEWTRGTGTERAEYFIDCKLCKKVSTIPDWIQDCYVDVLLVTVSGANLNTLVFNKRDQWDSYEKVADGFSQTLLRDPRVRRVTRQRRVALAVSGGGARSAILGCAFMRALKTMRITPSVISGCSGGAWAIIMHFARCDDNIVDTFHRNVSDAVSMSEDRREQIGILRAMHSPETLETLMFVLPLLKKMQYEWQNISRRLLWGSTQPNEWRIFGSRRVVFSTTLLCHSHAGSG